MAKKNDRTPTPVAVFNSKYILISIFGSILEASRVTGVVRQSIIKATYGETITAKKCYWRPIPPSVVLDQDDIGKLTIFDFDREAGNPDRPIYDKGKVNKRLYIIMESEYRQK